LAGHCYFRRSCGRRDAHPTTMQLAILIAVLTAIASAEGGGGPVAGVAWRLLVVVSATLIAPLAAAVGTHRLAIAVTADDDQEDAIAHFQTIIVGLWLTAVATILLVAQWPRIVRGNWQLAEWPLIDELAVLLPVVGSLLLVWAALYRLERAAEVAACRLRQLDPPPARLWNYIWANIRHQLALVVLPPLAVVALFESLAALKVPAASLDVAWWLMIPLAATMLVVMPAAVRRIWRTTPLDAGPLREVLDGVCDGRRCTVRDILIWHTDGTMANAAVIGVSRWLRYILLTDVLVARLSPDQIAAVVRHELAHLRRWHLPLRLALLMLPVVWWLAIKHVWPGADAAIESLVTAIGIRPQVVAAFVVPLGMLTYAVVVVGWCSRLLEHDADLDAALSDDGQIDPLAAATFCGALMTLCGRGHDNWFAEWLHPPLVKRLEFVKRAVIEPGFAGHYRRRMQRLAVLLALLYLAAVMIAVA